MPIAFFRNGVCVPLVTTPASLAADDTPRARAGDAAIEHLEADQLARRRRRPSAARSASAPMKSAFFQPTIQPRSASSAVVVSSMSLPYRRIAGFEAQRVARAEAARDRGSTLTAGLEQRLPDPVGRLRRHEDLEAVLAGVAGARHRGADAGDLAVREPVVLDRRQIDAGQRLQHLERRGPLDRDQRVARAGVDGDRVARRP